MLARYEDLVDDPSEFRAACSEPLMDTVWAHPDRPEAAELAGIPGVPCSWRPGAYRLTEARSDRFMVSYLLGGWHIQEESALTAVRALAPEPGMRVLDLCAAPGNKTAELALAVGTTGLVVANDVSAGRLGVIQTTMNRLGLTNVALWSANGVSLPIPDGWFDMVLADVPCSCEGTTRRHPDVLRKTVDHSRYAALQKRLLKEALRLVRPGGRVCYATCTFAPEENEGVVSSVLQEHPEMSVLPVTLDGLTTRPGLASFQGTRFHSDLQHAHRVWPQDNDTGGFFVCVLEKRGAPPARAVQTDDVTMGSPLSDDRFPWSALQVPRNTLSQWRVAPGHKYDRLVGTGMTLPRALSCAAAGIPCHNLKFADHRLSTPTAMVMAPVAVDGWVDVVPEDIRAFIVRDNTRMSGFGPASPLIPAAVARSGNVGLGLGHVTDAGSLESLFPGVWGGVLVKETLTGDGSGRK